MLMCIWNFSFWLVLFIFQHQDNEYDKDVRGTFKGGSKSNELTLKGTEYSAEYAQKLKDTYNLFKSNGYEISEHGLNRILGRINQGKISSIDEVIDVLNTGTKYMEGLFFSKMEFQYIQQKMVL